MQICFMLFCSMKLFELLGLLALCVLHVRRWPMHYSVPCCIVIVSCENKHEINGILHCNQSKPYDFDFDTISQIYHAKTIALICTM